MFYSPFEESRILSVWWLICHFDHFLNISGNTVNFFDIFYTDSDSDYKGLNYMVDAHYYWSDLSGFLTFNGFFSYIFYYYINVYFFSYLYPFDTNYNIALVLASGLSSYLFFFFSLNNKIAFRFFNSISEFVYYNMILPYLGSDGKRYFPFFLFLFFFIFFSNFLGLVPGFFAITSHFNVTLFLSSICWVSILLIGLYFHGIKFFSSFFPSKVPFALSPFLMLIEFISYLVRLASLSLRLFANIVAGHILLDTISMFFFYLDMSVSNSISLVTMFIGFFFWLLLLVMIGFELLIALLQAYIFVVLAVIYLNDSLHLHV